MLITVLMVSMSAWEQPTRDLPGAGTPSPSVSPAPRPNQIKASDNSPTPVTAASRTSQAEPQEPTRSPDILVSVAPEKDTAEKSAWRFIMEHLLSWQVVVLLIVGYLLFFPKAALRIKELFEPFQSLKLFGQEFVMDRKGGRDVEAVISQFRRRIQKQLDKRIKRLQINEKRNHIMAGTLRIIFEELRPRDLRSTIHIPDVLFAETLYQLLDYEPAHPESPRGRTFSSRFGIIGRAWRLIETEYAPQVSPDSRDLMRYWGMTEEEAKKTATGRQSFGCVVLKNDAGKPVGIFYLDARNAKAFGEETESDAWKRIESAVLVEAKDSGLVDALETIHRELIIASPRVDIYRGTHGDL